MSAFLSKMFDVGDLPVLTFGICVLKPGVIKWSAEVAKGHGAARRSSTRRQWWWWWWLSGLWNYTLRFFTFFYQNPKKHNFLRFFWVVTLVFSNTGGMRWWCSVGWPNQRSFLSLRVFSMLCWTLLALTSLFFYLVFPWDT